MSHRLRADNLAQRQSANIVSDSGIEATTTYSRALSAQIPRMVAQKKTPSGDLANGTSKSTKPGLEQQAMQGPKKDDVDLHSLSGKSDARAQNGMLQRADGV